MGRPRAAGRRAIRRRIVVSSSLPFESRSTVREGHADLHRPLPLARRFRCARHGVKAIYPSFDVVPPHLISGVVTDKGVYVPYLLGNYFDSDVKPFY